MTHQSRSWAYEQRDVPGDAWRVLYALANYANHRTGEIQYNPDEIAEESGVEAKSQPKYIGALRRNGYLAIDGKDKDKHYFLLIGRDPSQRWDWNAKELAEESDPAPSARPAPDLVPASFSAAAQAKARDRVKPEPRTEYPIVSGSKLDDEWTRWFRANKTLKDKPFERWITLKDGSHARGYYMPSALPPKEETQEQIAV